MDEKREDLKRMCAEFSVGFDKYKKKHNRLKSLFFQAKDSYITYQSLKPLLIKRGEVKENPVEDFDHLKSLVRMFKDYIEGEINVKDGEIRIRDLKDRMELM